MIHELFLLKGEESIVGQRAFRECAVFCVKRAFVLRGGGGLVCIVMNIMDGNKCFTVGIFVIIGLISPGLCIECYRCNSTGNLDCLEKFMYPNPLRPESCADVFEARYCIKTTGIYNGSIGTRRFCSSRDLGNYCDFITHVGDQREYKGCVYTCYGDGCNAAITNFQAPFLSALMTITAVVVFVSKRLLVPI